MKIARIAALCAALFTMATAAPAAAQSDYDADRVLKRVSSDDLRAVVSEMGYKVSGSSLRDRGFSLFVVTPEGKPNFYIFAEKCREPFSSCASVRLTTGYVPKAGLTLSQINSLNNQYVPKVSLETLKDGSQTVRTQTYLVMDNGMTMSNLRVNIVVFVRDLAQIKAQAGR